MSNSLVGLDKPIVQPIMVDINYPPYVPENIRIHPDVRYLLPYVSAVIINTVVVNINKHHARLLMFNLISNNYYRNEEFHEIVELCLGYIYTRVKRGYYANFDSAINQCVDEMCGMYSAYLIFHYSEIKSLIAPEIVSGAMQNIHKFNEAKAEVSAMFAHNGQFPNNTGFHGQHPNQVGFPGGFQQGMVVNQNYPPNMNPNHQVNPNMPMHVNQYPHNVTPAGGVFVNQQQFINRGPDNPHMSNVRNDRFSRMVKDDPVPQDRFSHRPSFDNMVQQPQPEVIEQVKAIEEPKKEADPTVMLAMVKPTEILFTKSNVSFIANSIELNNVERYGLHWVSIQHLSKETIDENSANNFRLLPISLLETNIENAIISGRAKQFERQKEDSNKNLFRCFSIITNPFFTTFDFSKYHKTLQACNNFEDLVLKLRSIAIALANHDDVDYSLSAGVITYLNLVDGMLTDLINDFLRNKIDLRITIGSFCEDATELRAYLIKKGIQYLDAYAQFEKDIIETMFVEVDEEALAIEETEMELPKGLNFYLFPINHSLTFTFLNNKELGLDIKDGLNEISMEFAPTIFRIAQDLFNQKKRCEVTTLVDMLVTVDNHRYKLYKDYCKQEVYYIRKM